MATIALLFTLLVGQSSGDSPSRDPRIEQAGMLLQQGKSSEAQSLYRTILSSDAANKEAQQGLVDASERLALEARARGDNENALRLLLSAQPFAPANLKLLYDLGVLEESMNLYADADQTVARLQTLAGLDDPKVLYLAARVKLDLGQLDTAEKQMRAYLVVSPNDASAHYGMGRILQLGQQLDGAETEFLRSIELQSKQTESYYQLGEIALAQTRYDDALSEFAKTLARDSSHVGALTGTGMALFRSRQYATALAPLQKAADLAPSYQSAHYYLGLSLARLGRKSESDRELARAAQLAEVDNQHDAQHLRILQSPPNNSSAPVLPR